MTSTDEKRMIMNILRKEMIYMKIFKRGGSRGKGEEETKSMPHASVVGVCDSYRTTSV